jgi:hypothetical protein
VSNVYGFIGDFSGATGAVTVDGRLDLDQWRGSLCRLYRQRHADHPQRWRGEQF